MAALRNLDLGLIRLAGITQITRTLERIAADRTRILPVIEIDRESRHVVVLSGLMGMCRAHQPL